MGTAKFITRVCSLLGMNKEESKGKVGINYANQSSPTDSAFKCSGAKRMLLQAPETHLNRLEIVYLAKINGIFDYIFTGGLEMLNPMTGIGSQASAHPYVYYISASKSWDPDAPLRLLTFYARQFDKCMKSWRIFFSCSKLDST